MTTKEATTIAAGLPGQGKEGNNTLHGGIRKEIIAAVNENT